MWRQVGKMHLPASPRRGSHHNLRKTDGACLQAQGQGLQGALGGLQACRGERAPDHSGGLPHCNFHAIKWPPSPFNTLSYPYLQVCPAALAPQVVRS